MDYTVGSVADLISGKNTPNKATVIKQQVINANRNSDNSANSVQLFATQDKTEQSDSTKTKRHDKKFKNKLPFKRNRSISDREVQQKPSFKNKNKHNNESDNNSNFTVIDHTQISKIEKQLTEGKFEESNGSKKDTNMKNMNQNNNKEVDSRTIFVGNVAAIVKKTQLLKFFGKYGKIVSVRLRCATPAEPGVSKRVAVIKKMLHPKRTTLHSYVTFEKREDALKATELNGKKYKEHFLRVQMCDDTTKPDSSKAIFIGNLPFDVEDDDLWKAFESCGPIISVRVVRNSSTGMGIGIGYVNFDSSDSVELALQMEDVTIQKQKVRIQRCYDKRKSRKEKYKNKKKREKQDVDDQKPKIRKENMGNPENKKPRHKKEKNKTFDKPATLNVKNSIFQGSRSNKKKQRPKVNKGVIQKMKLSQKVAPRST
ncbi:hypothetical protein ILUMI_04799 [Ignelater luminosus]|uniref:RRM domain-containing protein n=1 Tax=Ignelater luminosus TaxID=2038154 RepID=A0A8K0D8H4_IGNLU|nr:hypothetical protein ILUMI_04799 [Ignelater luminosus]